MRKSSSLAHFCWKSGAPFAHSWNSIQVILKNLDVMKCMLFRGALKKSSSHFLHLFLFANPMGQWCLCM